MFLQFIYLSLNYMLIFAVFIPSSPYHHMVKFIQMFFIQWDRAMYYEKNNVACQVRT